MNVDVENLVNELKETFPNDWGKEVSVKKSMIHTSKLSLMK